MDGPPAKHRFHSSISHPMLREWASDCGVNAGHMMWPLFIVPEDDAKVEIKALPGQYRWGVNRLKEALEGPVSRGLGSVLLFGVLTDDSMKTATGSAIDNPDQGPVIKALKALKKLYPKLLLAVDLCLCAYTTHGHCGILTEDNRIDNVRSIQALGNAAASFAKAGADVIAPSDMMDGRIAAIKEALLKSNMSHVAVMSYAAKFASVFYGPFRHAAGSGMTFGDRKGYQLPPGSRKLALRAVDRDVDEGADMVMVKPGMAYLDIIRDTAERVDVPVAVYQVSGEFSMLHAAAAAGVVEFKEGVMESLLAFRRAGATILISYFTPTVLEWLAEPAASAAGGGGGGGSGDAK